MVAFSSSSSPLKTSRSDEDRPLIIPDNSPQKIYWSFNQADDLDDNIVENDAPNATGKGHLLSDDTSTSITNKALQLASEKQIQGRINALDMRDSGVSLSFWASENGVIPQMRLTQIVDDVLTGEDSEAGTNFQSRVFDAFVITHQETSDQLSLSLARPDESPDDGTNNGTVDVLDYTVTLHGALSNGKDWHHIVILWNGEVNETEGEIVDLVVLIDGQSFYVETSGSTTQDTGAPLDSVQDYYQNAEGESIPASRFLISAKGVSSPGAIDEVRLIKGIISPALVRTFGASRHTSGEPLIVWNGEQRTQATSIDTCHNLSPIPELGDDYDAVAQGTVEQQNGALVLDGNSYLATNPHPLYIDNALAVDSWFKPNQMAGQLPLFEIDLSYTSTVEGTDFNIQQGFNVIYDCDKEAFQVNVTAKDIADHEISTEDELRTALTAVLTNTIPNQKFKIVITDDILLSSSLPSLLSSEFAGGGPTLAPGTVLTIESDSTDPPKFISGQKNTQILVIDADDAIINLRNLELCDGESTRQYGSAWWRGLG